MKHLDLSSKTVVPVNLEGNFTGHAAIFDIEDNECDIIVPAAFIEYLSRRNGVLSLMVA